MFQDDVARVGFSLEAAQNGNHKMEAVAETKLLESNVEKSGFLVAGPQKAKRLIHKEYQRKPLTLCGTVMKEETEMKYLGDWISSSGLAESVALTVRRRRGLATLSIYETRSIIED